MQILVRFSDTETDHRAHGRLDSLQFVEVPGARWVPLALSLFVLCPCPPLAWAGDFSRFEIDAQPARSPYIKVAGDLDRDGKTDIVIGGAKGPLVWYRHPGWAKSVIAAGGYESVDGEAADVDRDGDLDLVIGGVLWYENPLPRSKPDAGPWPAHRIAPHRTHDVEVADLDGDGQVDVVVRGQTGFGHKEGHRILIFRQRAPADWASRELACPEGEGLQVTDLNRDGRPDIVIGTRWFENPGKAADAPWPEHVYTTHWNQGDCKVAVADFNGDDRLDIVLSPAEPKGQHYRVAWYEAPANTRQAEWTEHVIAPEVETVVHALDAADMDGDGAADVAFARMHQGAPPQEVAVYLNRDRGRRWEKRTVSERGSHNLLLADLDGDGRADILGANHSGAFQPVELWLNRLSPTSRPPDAATRMKADASESGTNVVFRCDFESETWFKEWGATKAPERTALVSADPERKFAALRGKALRVRIDQGGHYGLSLDYAFKKRLGHEPEEVYFRHYLRFAADWNPRRGGKLPGIGGTYGRAGWGGRPVDGADGWSARGLFEGQKNGRTPVGFYCYHMDMQGQYGSNWVWDRDGLGFLENNRWYCLEQYAKLNTPGQANGILRGWVDGQLAFEKTNVRMRAVDTLKIESVWINFYLGGTWTAERDHHVYVDEAVISAQYIGPLKAMSP